MLAPNVLARGQAFTMRPAIDVVGVNTLAPSSTEFEVDAPGFEDWRQLVVVRKASGWRSYRRETVESYSTAFNHGGHTVHYRYHAIRSDLDGRPLGATATKEAALARLQRAFLADEVMPA